MGEKEQEVRDHRANRANRELFKQARRRLFERTDKPDKPLGRLDRERDRAQTTSITDLQKGGQHVLQKRKMV